jgi:hypothetical protein
MFNISIESGILSSFTAFFAINEAINQPVQEPLTLRETPMTILLGPMCLMSRMGEGGEFYPI